MADVEGENMHPKYHPTQPSTSTAAKAVTEDGFNENDEVAMERVERVYK